MNRLSLLRIAQQAAAAVPAVMEHLSADTRAAIKAGWAGDLSSINAAYHDAITQALVNYFEGGGIAASRNGFKRATIQAFGNVFDLGFTDGGGELPQDESAMSWIEARINAEFGHIETLMQEAKDLRKETDFDYFAWSTARADGYTNTLREIYNNGRLRATADQMVTFEGDDGAESCETCQKLKGKRHKISWFIARNFVPPFGTGLDCHQGGRCQHGLMDAKGNWVTV